MRFINNSWRFTTRLSYRGVRFQLIMYYRYLASTIILCLILTGCGQRGLEFSRELYINSSHTANNLAEYKQREVARRYELKKTVKRINARSKELEIELRSILVGKHISLPITRLGEPTAIGGVSWLGKIYTWRDGGISTWIEVSLSTNAEGIIKDVSVKGGIK